MSFFLATLDFSDTTTTLTFNPISLTRNVTVPITDDNFVEAVETFFATLTAEDDQPVDLSPDLADIDILDLVDRECIVELCADPPWKLRQIHQSPKTVCFIKH